MTGMWVLWMYSLLSKKLVFSSFISFIINRQMLTDLTMTIHSFSRLSGTTIVPRLVQPHRKFVISHLLHPHGTCFTCCQVLCSLSNQERQWCCDVRGNRWFHCFTWLISLSTDWNLSKKCPSFISVSHQITVLQFPTAYDSFGLRA